MSKPTPFEKALTAVDALVLAVPEAGFGNNRALVTIQNLEKVGWKLVPCHYPSPGPSGYSPVEFINPDGCPICGKIEAHNHDV